MRDSNGGRWCGNIEREKRERKGQKTAINIAYNIWQYVEIWQEVGDQSGRKWNVYCNIFWLIFSIKWMIFIRSRDTKHFSNVLSSTTLFHIFLQASMIMIIILYLLTWWWSFIWSKILKKILIWMCFDKTFYFSSSLVSAFVFLNSPSLRIFGES